MNIEDILTPERCFCKQAGISKKRLLSNISEKLAAEHEDLAPEDIFDALMAREQLGSTGIGNGLAIPHCRVPYCSEVIGALVTLEEAIEFDAVDGKPVDILFVLLVPEDQSDEHVKTLAALAELFSDEDFCLTIRQTLDAEDLYNIVIMY